MTRIKVADISEVVEGKLHVAKAGGKSIVLTRINGQCHALENKCPHLGLPLAKGKLEGGVITCPWHGSSFDFCSGKNQDWANSFVGIPLPKWTHKALALGKAPQDVTVIPVEEDSQGIFASL